jgi:hypothetical protein
MDGRGGGGGARANKKGARRLRTLTPNVSNITYSFLFEITMKEWWWLL